MIPKVIHYCWFGGKELPKIAKRCLASWQKFCPDYEIKQWDESNFDVNITPYTSEAYKAKKYAFVSDYARFCIIRDNGGVYLDTDVELLKSLDPLLEHSAYMGFEKNDGVNSGVGFGAEKEQPLISQIVDLYTDRKFITDGGKLDLTTVVKIVTDLLVEKGLVLDGTKQEIENCIIYPTEYFQPIDMRTQKKTITENTFSIHLYDASWYSPTRRLLSRIKRFFKRIFGRRKE